MTDSESALYVSETECARRAGIPASRWRRLAPVYERIGLVRKDMICGLRYWPAVKAFFDRHNGIADAADGRSVLISLQEQDGKENPNGFKTTNRRRARA